jgi:hypothetical protein
MVKTQKKLKSKQKVNHKKTKYLRKKHTFEGGDGQTGQTGQYVSVNSNGNIRQNANLYESPSTAKNENIYNTIKTPPLPDLDSLKRLLDIAQIIEKKEKEHSNNEETQV